MRHELQAPDWEVVAFAPAGATPSLPALAGGEVHLLSAWLPVSSNWLARFSGLLSADESARAGRFLRAQDRERFIVAHGLTRMILGEYLEQDPATLALCRGACGKPRLSAPEHAAWEFNLSHSGAVVLLAVSRAGEVGVDAERVDPTRRHEDIARRLFSPAEVNQLHSLSPARRTQAFYDCWTALEARVKATGRGLVGADGLQRGESQTGSAGTLIRVELGEEYRGALVVLGPTPPFCRCLRLVFH